MSVSRPRTGAIHSCELRESLCQVARRKERSRPIAIIQSCQSTPLIVRARPPRSRPPRSRPPNPDRAAQEARPGEKAEPAEPGREGKRRAIATNDRECHQDGPEAREEIDAEQFADATGVVVEGDVDDRDGIARGLAARGIAVQLRQRGYRGEPAQDPEGLAEADQDAEGRRDGRELRPRRCHSPRQQGDRDQQEGGDEVAAIAERDRPPLGNEERQHGRRRRVEAGGPVDRPTQDHQGDGEDAELEEEEDAEGAGQGDGEARRGGGDADGSGWGVREHGRASLQLCGRAIRVAAILGDRPVRWCGAR